MSGQDRYWERAPLDGMTDAQWEALCDGCACCCLHKLADEETGDVYYTDVACPLLDVENCRCRDYDHRHERMPACVRLTPETVMRAAWLPSTCAYRLRAMGKPLPRWHHLITGSREDVHRWGASVRGRAVLLDDPDDDTLMARIIECIPVDTGFHLLLPSQPHFPEGEPS